jgi:hypothetical protein
MQMMLPPQQQQQQKQQQQNVSRRTLMLLLLPKGTCIPSYIRPDCICQLLQLQISAFTFTKELNIDLLQVCWSREC